MTTFDRLSAALSDRYNIDRQLGQGGMATVYLAEDLKHDRKIALKGWLEQTPRQHALPRSQVECHNPLRPFRPPERLHTSDNKAPIRVEWIQTPTGLVVSVRSYAMNPCLSWPGLRSASRDAAFGRNELGGIHGNYDCLIA